MSQGDRQQQYEQLLQQVLNEPQQMNELFQENKELISQDFLHFLIDIKSNTSNEEESQTNLILLELIHLTSEQINSHISTIQADIKYASFLEELLNNSLKSLDESVTSFEILSKNKVLIDDTFKNILKKWIYDNLKNTGKKDYPWILDILTHFLNDIKVFSLVQKNIRLKLLKEVYEVLGLFYSNKEFPEEWALIQNSLANCYSDIEIDRPQNLRKSIFIYLSLIDFYSKNNALFNLSVVYNNLGLAYSSLYDTDFGLNIEKSIEYFSLSSQIRNKKNFPKEWAITQRNLGLVHLQRSEGNLIENREKSIKYFNNALDVFSLDSHPKEWAMTQNNLGLVYSDLTNGNLSKNIEAAIKCFEKALLIRTESDYPEAWALVNNNLGLVYRKRIKGDYQENLQKALEYHQKALTKYCQASSPIKWAGTYNNIGNVFREIKQNRETRKTQKAIFSYEKALEVYTEHNTPEEWGITMQNLGLAWSELKDGNRQENLNKAVECLLLSLKVRSQRDFPEKWAMTQSNMGAVYSQLIQYDSKCTRLSLDAYNKASIVYSHESFPRDWAMLQNNIALTHQENQDVEKAILHFRHALSIRTPETIPLDCLQSSRNLGNLFFSEKQWKESIETYELAIKAIEVFRAVAISDRRRQEIIAESIEVFANITQSHVELNQIDQALTYAERSKARNLTELLASRELYPKGDIDPEIIEKLKQLRSKIPTLDRQLQVLEPNRNETNPLTQQAREQISTELKQARTELDQVLEEIQPIDPTFTLTQTVQPITFTEIQDLLDDQTAIVEWYITQAKTFTFIVTKDQTQPILHTVETKIIADAVQKYLELYEQTQRFTNPTAKEKFRAISADLCEALQLNEILAQLQAFDLTKLILIPHRYLHFLPLHALSLADGSCLLDKFSAGVSYAPSCQLLQVLERQEKSEVEHFFAIKNPTEDLLFSELEVEAISDYFSETDILDRHNASESNFRYHPNLEKLSHLHFSCHGTFDFQSPLNSALLLNKTANNEEDNRLTLAEIFELNLPNCRLVSLSACETGITDLSSLGDEYVGLPSGFIYAGASAVISSLWPVEDLATSLLMMKLYHNLRQDSHHVAVALNQAQHWMRTLTSETGQAFLDDISPIIKRRLPEKKAQLYLNTLSAVLLKPESDYRHPYYWAAFTAVGI